MNKRPGYSPEELERAARLVLISEPDHNSRRAAIKSVARKIDCTPETLRAWINKSQVVEGINPGVITDDSGRIKALESEYRELKRANKFLRSTSAFCPSVARRAGRPARSEEVVCFIDTYREHFGVEPICKVLQLTPSTYYRHKQLEREPDKRSARVKRDEELEIKITEIWEDSFRNYGILKIWQG